MSSGEACSPQRLIEAIQLSNPVYKNRNHSSLAKKIGEYIFKGKAEQAFLEVQAQRREKQSMLSKIQERRKGLSSELDKVNRGDEKYLKLITEDFEIMKEEDQIKKELEEDEKEERGTFAFLSSSVRESHEKERARTERTKYWSIIGSIIGAIIGIMGTSINNYLRMRELRGIVKESAEGGIQVGQIVNNMSSTLGKQQEQIQSFIKDLYGLLGNTNINNANNSNKIPQFDSSDVGAEQLEKQTKEILDVIKKQDETMDKEMQDIKKMLAVSRTTDSDGNIVYVGPDMQHLLDNTEKNLEWKMKMNALWTATMVYAALALTAPIVYQFFRGS